MEYAHITYALVAIGALVVLATCAVAVYLLGRVTCGLFLDHMQAKADALIADVDDEKEFILCPVEFPQETADEQFARLEHFLESESYSDDSLFPDDEEDEPNLIAGGKPQMQRLKKRWPSYKPPHKG